MTRSRNPMYAYRTAVISMVIDRRQAFRQLSQRARVAP